MPGTDQNISQLCAFIGLLMPVAVGRLQFRPGFDLDWRSSLTDLLTYLARPVTDHAATCDLRNLKH